MSEITEEQALREKSVHDDLFESLELANQTSDGQFEYFTEDDALFVNVYGEECSLDQAGRPVPDAVYRIDITTTLQEES